MSYAIVKGIRIDKAKKEVWLKAASNNVSPRRYEWFESKSLSEILQKEGLVALEKELLEQYWNGNFQKSGNLYDRAVQYYSRTLPYTWANTGPESDIGKERFDERIEYSYAQLQDALYKKYLEYKKRKKGNYFVKHNGHFVRKLTTKHIFYATEPARALRFNSYEDALLFAQKISYDEASEMVVAI